MGSNVGKPTRRSFLKRTGIASATALAGVTGTASAEGKQPGNSGGGPRRLTIDLASEVQTLDPLVSLFDDVSGRVVEQLHEGLFEHPDGETDVVGGIAADYVLDESQTVYTITLDDRARFHDPQFGAVTAEDVVYSFERAVASPHSPWVPPWLLLQVVGIEHDRDEDGNYVPGSLGVRAVDEKTVEIELESPFYGTLEVLSRRAFAILPAGIVGDVPGYDGVFDYETFATSRSIGAGPFALREWGDGVLRLDRFRPYHRNRPAREVHGIDYHIVADADDRYERAVSGQVDVFSIPDSEYDPSLLDPKRIDDRGREFGEYGPLPSGETVEYVSATSLTSFYVGFNTEQVPRPVRRALAWGLDQDAVSADLFQGRSRPAYHFTPPNLYPGGPAAYDDHAAGYPYGTDVRVERARQVMEDAGYDDSNRYELRFTTYPNDNWAQLGQRLSQRLADAHIDLTVEEVRFGELLSRGRQGDLEAFVLGWIADWADASNFLKLLNPPYTDTSQENIPGGYFDWGGTSAAEQAADAWETIQTNQGSTASARQVRARAAVTIEEANWTDAVLLPIHHPDHQRFWHDRVDVPAFGALGAPSQALTDVTLNPKGGSNGQGR
ncbi:ABC transporter substrate-binding protein [Haloarchaeobius sp. TZWSO28]|uniref:ABC transporter substrate-binding protein n=1 Tax=Haloarchaeobius sp. TZWSO28 TaxID=3446119 RepID=UPI003EBF99EA